MLMLEISWEMYFVKIAQKYQTFFVIVSLVILTEHASNVFFYWNNGIWKKGFLWWTYAADLGNNYKLEPSIHCETLLHTNSLVLWVHGLVISKQRVHLCKLFMYVEGFSSSTL